MDITKQENSLFDKWKEDKSYMRFVEDGVVCLENFEKQPVKILFVLKEANSRNDEKGFDLRYLLRHGNSKNYKSTWENIARLTKAILLQDNEYPKTIDMKYWHSKIAVMNLKKEGGKGRAKSQEIKKYAQADCDFLLKQIKIYSPDLIVCCGENVARCLKEYVFQINDNQWKSIECKTDERIYYFTANIENLKVPAVAFKHPNYKYNVHSFWSKRYGDMCQTAKELLNNANQVECN